MRESQGKNGGVRTKQCFDSVPAEGQALPLFHVAWVFFFFFFKLCREEKSK